MKKTHSGPPSHLATSLIDPLSPYRLALRFGEILDASDIVHLSQSANAAQRVEKKFQDLFKRAIFHAAFRALDDLARGQFDPDNFDFSQHIVDHSIASMRAGMHRPRPVPTRLAAGKALSTIFEMWDRWRKGRISPRQKKNANSIQEVFLHTVQTFWRKHSQDFLKGGSYDMQEAKEAFSNRARIPLARASMIVNTETTVYLNTARRTIYDQADGVTHYLFVAVRDKRTTKWCADFRKGGRDGLVYVKGDVVTDRETPACHWNCRSEILPLSPSNPRHLALIQDKRRARDNNSPEPLPRGWNGR